MVEVEETGEGEIELDGGTYYANATFDNLNYNSIIENATFTVYPTSKYEMMVNVTEDIIYGENATLNVTINATLPGVIDGFVNVTVGGMNFSAPVNQGYATLNITGLKPGKYVFDVTYSGNANYTNKSVNAEINVQKVLIDAADAKYGLENSYEYIAKIVSENGTALANKTVTFTINGKTYIGV